MHKAAKSVGGPRQESHERDVHRLVRGVEETPEFQRLASAVPSLALAHVFCHAKAGNSPVEVGYYDPSAATITVFTTDPVTVSDAQEVFRSEEGKVLALDLSSVTVGLSQARERAETHRAGKYAAHPTLQEICILQQRDRPVWTVTLVTATLNLLTLRIDAVSGDVLSEEFRHIMDLRASD